MRNEDFGGTIGDTWRDSTPWWPPEPHPPESAPNVVVVVLDDVGYAQLGCYGSDLDTPTIDGLAARGIRLGNFHTTALCSPTRACLMTGRNHHRVGMGRVADLAVGYPGYSGDIGPEHGFLPELLGAAGYASYAVGKWHLTPEDETHMAAPRRSWPVGRGFLRWYGFHGGETHQFVPSLYQDNQWVHPPDDPDYHLSEDLADHAIAYLADHRAVDHERPFFLYLATGACHSPHHAPPAWIDRYAGHFDDGWDAWRERAFARQLDLGLVPPGTTLSPRPPWVPAWDELKPEHQRVAARFMECFAGYLSHADHQIGRVLDFIDQSLDERDDTLVVLLSDNGASAEGGKFGSLNDARIWNGIPTSRRELTARIDELGGPSAHNNYPWGWTMAGNTPFKRWKREVHEGGVADPCIISWPARLGDHEGTVRRQYAHAIDILPTILDLTGTDAPATLGGVAQTEIQGTSITAWLTDADRPSDRTTQYFEMLGSRAIYHDGWKAVTFKPLGPMYDDGLDPDAPFEDDRWELYRVADDFAECVDLAAERPEVLQDLIDRWWTEARANDVLPLDNRPLAALLDPRPSAVRHGDRFRYYPNVAPVPESVAVNIRNRTHAITIDAVLPDRPANGVLLAQGSVLGGWTLYLRDGSLRYEHNVAGTVRHQVIADGVVASGAHQLGFEFEKTADFAGTGRLFVDGTLVGEQAIEFVTPARFSITGSGLTCGYEVGPAVSHDYVAPFRFDGTITRAVVDVTGHPYRDVAAELAAILSEQ